MTLRWISFQMKSEVLDSKQSDENAILESLGYFHEAPPQMNRTKASIAIATKATCRGLHVPAFHDDTAKKVETLETTEPERIAIFAKGVTAFDIPVPRSMKGSKAISMYSHLIVLIKCEPINIWSFDNLELQINKIQVNYVHFIAT